MRAHSDGAGFSPGAIGSPHCLAGCCLSHPAELFIDSIRRTDPIDRHRLDERCQHLDSPQSQDVNVDALFLYSMHFPSTRKMDGLPDEPQGDIQETHVNGQARVPKNDVDKCTPCLHPRTEMGCHLYGEDAYNTPSPGDQASLERPSSRSDTLMSSNTPSTQSPLNDCPSYLNYGDIPTSTIERGVIAETSFDPSHSSNASHKGESRALSSTAPQGVPHPPPTHDSHMDSKDDDPTFLKVLGLVMEEAPLDILLRLRLTSWALYHETNAWLAYQFVVGKDDIDTRILKSAQGHSDRPRFVLELRGPEEGCSGCKTDLELERPRCQCISQTLQQLANLPDVPFDIVRVWVNSDQNLADFEDGEENLIKAKTTVYIVNIVHDPEKWAYLPTSPIGGSTEVTINMVVDPASTAELPTKPPLEYGKPNPNVTYRYFFTSSNPTWHSTRSLNKWPGEPVERKIGFLDVFTAHLAKTQFVDEPAKTYLVGSEAWPAEWMAAHRLRDEDWEQDYDVAVHDYVSYRIFPKIVEALARLRQAEGLLRNEEEAIAAVISATESYDWMTWYEYDVWLQKQHGLDLSFVLNL